MRNSAESVAINSRACRTIRRLEKQEDPLNLCLERTSCLYKHLHEDIRLMGCSERGFIQCSLCGCDMSSSFFFFGWQVILLKGCYGLGLLNRRVMLRSTCPLLESLRATGVKDVGCDRDRGAQFANTLPLSLREDSFAVVSDWLDGREASEMFPGSSERVAESSRSPGGYVHWNRFFNRLCNLLKSLVQIFSVLCLNTRMVSTVWLFEHKRSVVLCV